MPNDTERPGLADIHAPWTDEQVKSLNDYQKSGAFHPFTCANRGDGKHIVVNGDLGGLLATPQGWTCLSCDYEQKWAFVFMADDSWRGFPLDLSALTQENPDD